ncbi:Gmad2 immunoglobulin-like domain-containing protein, partial [Candidatus Parcubacteria bacterium]|nr:Gmad2 immunoglobulin-like domain-containing protein [Candidatus Parcubacteria bacterium]
GQTARVEGVETNSVVKVSKFTIVNASKGDLIWLATPLPNQVVSSPLTIAGRARGSWFFEASFPIKILDAAGKVIAQGNAKAQGSWMTTDYVSFTASLAFTKPSSATGTLVLEKDNPSGLPANANELRIPIKFQ